MAKGGSLGGNMKTRDLDYFGDRFVIFFVNDFRTASFQSP